MTGGAGAPPVFEFEAFGAAVGSSLVCGALSVLVPVLIAPTASLAALAVAGWLSLTRRRGSLTKGGVGHASVIAFGILGGAGAGFVASPAFLAPFRGLLLAGGLVPLFVADRIRSLRPTPVFTRP